MNPTPEQIGKLPKWAQERIQQLERELRHSEAHCKSLIYVNNKTPSPFFVDEWTATPRYKRYISVPQQRICVEHLGIHCEIFLPYPGDGQRLQGIEVSWRDVGSPVNVSAALVPCSRGTIQIVPAKLVR